MRLVQYNILASRRKRADGSPAGEVRMAAVRARLVERQADVLCLQEVEADWHCFLSEPAGLGETHVGRLHLKPRRVKGSTVHDGCAIFVRRSSHAVVSEWTGTLVDEANQVAMGLLVKARRAAHSVGVFTTHLKAGGPEHEALRVRQMKALVETIRAKAQEWQPDAVFLAGDLNTGSGSPTMRVATTAGWRDANPQPHGSFVTYSHRGTDVLDHVLYRPSRLPVRCVGWEVLPGHPIKSRFPSAAQPSDHFPLCADFEIGN